MKKVSGAVGSYSKDCWVESNDLRFSHIHHLLTVWCRRSQRFEEYASDMGIIVVRIDSMLRRDHGTGNLERL